MRTTVLRLAEDRFQICLVVHHIVWDGWSTAVWLMDGSAPTSGSAWNRPPSRVLSSATRPVNGRIEIAR